MGFLNKLFGRSESNPREGKAVASTDPERDFSLAKACVSSDRGRAIELYTLAAQAGHAQAMYELGCLLAHHPASEKDGIAWLEKAGNGGSQEATTALIEVFDKKHDYDSAMMWCRKSVVQNNAQGMYYYGYFCARGLGVTQNAQAALNWYSRAADAGSGRAMIEMARMLYEGTGTEKDLHRALDMVTRAEESGVAGAAELKSQIEDDLQSVSELDGEFRSVVRMAEAGDPAQQYKLACLYLEHSQTMPNAAEESDRWMQEAAKNGNADAQFILGDAALNASPQNTDDALYWYKLAAENEDESAADRAALALAILLIRLRKDPDVAEQYLLRVWNRSHDARALMALSNCCILMNRIDEAFEWAKKATENNDPEGFYMLGLIHLNTMGNVGEGTLAAIESFKKASEMGHALASYELAHIYRGEYDLPRNGELDIEYTGIAAEQGHADAQCDYGIIAMGMESSEAHKAGIQILSEAAEKGQVEANYILGRLYGTGYRVNKDPNKALRYYAAAADKGHDLARVETGWMVMCGFGIKANPEKGLALLQVLIDDEATSDEARANAMYYLGLAYSGAYTIEKDEEKHVQMLCGAAELGNAEAMYEYALLFALGEGVKQDFLMCFEWLQKAADKDNPKAYYYLGGMYEEGVGVRADPSQALRCFEKAAEDGVPLALYHMYEIYSNGELNVEVDILKALRYLTRSAEAGCDDAYCRLGVINYTGEYDVGKDFAKAKYWFELAAKEQNGEAYYWLAQMYATGDGVPVDFIMSRKLCHMAIENDYPKAGEILKILDDNHC